MPILRRMWYSPSRSSSCIILPVDLDAARGRLERAADQAQQRGLAAAADPHDRDHLAARDHHVDAGEDRAPVS